MPMITNSEYGMVSVNNTVLSKLIVENILSMDNQIIPSNKKGKIIKRGFFTGLNEMLNAVEISESPDGIKVKVYYVLKDNSRYEETSEKLFNMIEKDFELLCLDPPTVMIANIKGILDGQVLSKKDTEMVRRNEH